jgi:hypothetical protein
MTLLQSGITKSLAVSYDIDNSVRFNEPDTAYLEKTFASAGNRKTWTFSCWIKRTGPLTDEQTIFGAGSVTDANKLAWKSNDTLYYIGDNDGSKETETLAVYRDPSAWYHVVLRVDTTQATAADRERTYVNGVQQELNTEGTVHVDQEFETQINSNVTHRIGVRSYSTAHPLGSNLAEVYFIDGSSLAPSSFGELDSTTNQWIPIDASGLTFGTNGFYQKYGSDPGLVIDSFTSTGADTWTCPVGVTSVEVLTVAGGGAGGRFQGGGGGAGGIVHDSTYAVTAGVVYDLTVGAGGVGAYNTVGGNGGDSVWNVNAEGSGLAFTSKGGGGGGGKNNLIAADGGSGGGSGGYTTTASSSNQASFSGATSYGNIGGVMSNITYYQGMSGGGGAGAVGGEGSSGDGAAGGVGVLFSSFTSYGASGYFSGGGGGSVYLSGTPGSGGTGGGGAGAAATAVAGTANTGGGGGGSGNNGSTSGDGGSGIIIIKYGTSFGKDYSGEGNDFAVTNLVATDQMLDTPTNNFATINPLDGNGAYSEGNLKVVTPA